MEPSKPLVRFTMGKQSSLAPDRHTDDEGSVTENDEVAEGIDPGVWLMYLANGGDLEGIRELLNSGVDVNFKDIDGRSALHVAACQGFTDVATLLLDRGVEIDPKDHWGSTVTPLPATMSEFLISVCDRLLEQLAQIDLGVEACERNEGDNSEEELPVVFRSPRTTEMDGGFGASGAPRRVSV